MEMMENATNKREETTLQHQKVKPIRVKMSTGPLNTWIYDNEDGMTNRYKNNEEKLVILYECIKQSFKSYQRLIREKREKKWSRKGKIKDLGMSLDIGGCKRRYYTIKNSRCNAPTIAFELYFHGTLARCMDIFVVRKCPQVRKETKKGMTRQAGRVDKWKPRDISNSA